MADRNISVSVIVPLFNEEGNIKELNAQINNALKSYDYEIIYVDDGSTDSTLAELHNIASGNPNVKLIALARNFGQSAAFQAGFDNASKDIIATMDGDLQNDPADIPALISKIISENYDMVAGWRKKRKDPFLFRRIPSLIANKMISSFLTLSIHDTGCSLKVFRKELLNDLKLYGEMHRFIPYLVFAKGARIAEMPVNHRKRSSGKGKYGLSRTSKVLLDMLTVKFLNEYSTNPIYAMGGISIVLMMLSAMAFILLVLMKIFMHVDMTGNPLLIISVFLLMISIQIIMLGLISEIQVRIYFETRNRDIYKIREKENFEK